MDPIGKREDEHTEFKRAEALKEPSNIAREAVAFLNADGGEIWIGVEEDGEGLGLAVEEIHNPGQQRARLQDSLVDVVEPSPMIGKGKELDIDEVPFSEDGTRKLLRLRVARGARGPYALLRQQGSRAYLVR